MAEEETYSAKQIARRIGTDAKTFRKWLRSTASPYPAVGQGQRYEFPVTDLEHIKLHFNAWKTRSARKTAAPLNGHSKPFESIDLSVTPTLARIVQRQKLSKAEFMAEREARGKARDKEYGTVDGEYPEEPTDRELDELDDPTLYGLELDEFDEFND